MKLKPLLLILAALAAALLYASPYIALHEMRAAAVARDTAKLGGYVDFASLRGSLKTGVQARLLGSDRNERGEPSAAQAMGAAVAGALLSPMVDALITPESLSRLLQGQSPAKAVTGVGSDQAPAASELDTQMGYEGLNHFVFSVRKKGTDEDPVDLVLARHGIFGWKLAELRLP